MSGLNIPGHLERVSRSFAFCIARLEAPLRDQVGLAYLLCRILDTIEDASWRTAEAQMKAFEAFIEIIRQAQRGDDLVPANCEAFLRRLSDQTSNVNDGEMKLIEDAWLVFERLQRFAPDVRDVIVSPVVSMAQGMRSYIARSQASGGKLVLRDLADVNRYCFFVAGVVGEILNGLLRIAGLNRGLKIHSSLADGFRFGLFLQKVNILKDRVGDLREGRNLVPDVPKVFQSALHDATFAFRYVLAIPAEFESYRLFCAWSLFLGLASLPHIRREEKIGRLETVALLAQVELAIRSPSKLTRMFDHKLEPWVKEFRQGFQAAAKDVAGPDLETYRELYVGHACDNEILAGVNLVNV
jgi:phytoene/squalene synthetase